MLLRNWYVYRMIKECRNTGYSSVLNVNNSLPNDKRYQIRKYDGDYVSDNYLYDSQGSINGIYTYLKPYTSETNQYDLNTSMISYPELLPVLGQGNDAVTFEDYRMDEIILRSNNYYKVLSGATTTFKDKEDLSGGVCTVQFNCKALKDIVITEIGLQGGYGYSKAVSFYPILLIREVLEIPIEAKANQTFTVSFDIDMPYPSILETPIGENPEG